jgi:hypothetical protein
VGKIVCCVVAARVRRVRGFSLRVATELRAHSASEARVYVL